MKLVLVVIDYGLVAALAAIYCIALALTGDAILRALGVSRSGRQAWPVDVAAGFMIGQGVLGTVWQTLATFNAFYWWPVALILVAGSAWGIRPFIPELKSASIPSWHPRMPERSALPHLVFAAAACALMLLFAPLTVLPPGTDAMAFYISQPKLVSATHGIALLAGYESFAQIGLGSEMHYAAFFTLGGDHFGGLAGKLFIWLVGVATLVLAWGIGKRLGLEPLGRWFIVILILTSSAFTLVLWDGKTDLVPNGLAVLALYILLAAPLSKGDVGAAGLSSGLAIAGKLSFIPSFGLTVGFLLIHQIVIAVKRHEIISRLTAAGIRFAVFAAIPMLALALKNAVVYGEPFAPFILIHGGQSTILNQVWFSPENTDWIVATYPLALVFGRYPMQHGNLSVLMLAALPLFFLPAIWKRSRGPVFVFALAGLAGVLAWVILRPSVLAPRYILPSLLALTPAVALAMAWFWSKGGNLGRAMLSVAMAVAMLIPARDAITTAMNNKAYLTALPRKLSHPIWRTADMANHSPRADVRVFNSMYYSSMYRSDLLASMVALGVEDLRNTSRSMPEFWDWLYHCGITHVSYDSLTHETRLGSPINPNHTPDWLEVRETKIDARFSSYELVPKSGAPDVAGVCEPKPANTKSSN